MPRTTRDVCWTNWFRATAFCRDRPASWSAMRMVAVFLSTSISAVLVLVVELRNESGPKVKGLLTSRFTRLSTQPPPPNDQQTIPHPQRHDTTLRPRLRPRLRPPTTHHDHPRCRRHLEPQSLSNSEHH